MRKPPNVFEELMAANEPKPDDFDPAAVLDALEQLVEVLSGLRTRLVQAGFSETAAEQVCVQQHYGFIAQDLK